ncbi:MAG TPA: helix-turn-helix domain-containing protein [Candidatus Nanoarchaeia archaeon]|nr:helix-turn-helix domain-containing protein [Candidatus Nanoarchaeia archaeon]
MDNILRSFDLTPNEIKIYTKLLELGSGRAGQLTAETGIHRRNVYDSIERLLKKGLVGYINKNNRRYFTATNPKHFFALIEKEQHELEEKKKEFQNILPQLLLTQKIAKNKQRVTVFEGKKGLVTILEDVVKTGKPNCVLSTTGKQLAIIQKSLSLFHQKRVKARIPDRIIVNKKDLKRARELAKLPHTHVRVTLREFDSPFVINIYGDKVGMLILSETPIAILIEDKEVNRAFRNYFKLLWEMAEDPSS